MFDAGKLVTLEGTVKQFSGPIPCVDHPDGE
jgi:hypothetical protein